MIHSIAGFDLHLDVSNPETPKFVSGITGEGQRASYTDVLLVLLIERIDVLIEKQPEALQLGETVHGSPQEHSATEKDGEQAKQPAVHESKRSSRTKKPAGEE